MKCKKCKECNIVFGQDVKHCAKGMCQQCYWKAYIKRLGKKQRIKGYKRKYNQQPEVCNKKWAKGILERYSPERKNPKMLTYIFLERIKHAKFILKELKEDEGIK